MISFLISAILALAVIFGFVVFLHGAPYVPSRRRDLAVAFDELYRLGKNDVLLDIGAGDGVVLRAAARRGAKAIGYELNPILVMVGRWLNRKVPNTTTVMANFYHVELPENTTVVYFFAEARDIGRMAEFIQKNVDRIGKDVKVISLAFEIPGRSPECHVEPYFMYNFTPLHNGVA